MDAFFSLSFLLDQNEVYITDKIIFHVDMSKPLTDLQVEKVLEYVKIDIAKYQRENKMSKSILAKDMDELLKVNDIPDLKVTNYVKLKEIHKAVIPSLNNATKAKNLLCGLIILTRYLLQPKPNSISLEKLYGDLSSELEIELGNSFSVHTIESAYKEINKIYKQNIIDITNVN
ncbi:hypothetical protein [Proteus alimentorum]|uniref:hypothetical protein n=1 Tax=Proteus alimentorum TaxID=1973495 RepID=UPI000BFF966E|nr:hypothetical protein [Proteus alimentorum]